MDLGESSPDGLSKERGRGSLKAKVGGKQGIFFSLAWGAREQREKPRARIEETARGMRQVRAKGRSYEKSLTSRS